MIQPGFKLETKHENMGSIYSSKLAIKTLAGWGGKNLDILFSCNTLTGFSDRNSDPKLCAVSIANNCNCNYLGKLKFKSIVSIGNGLL